MSRDLATALNSVLAALLLFHPTAHASRILLRGDPLELDGKVGFQTMHGIHLSEQISRATWRRPVDDGGRCAERNLSTTSSWKVVGDQLLLVSVRYGSCDAPHYRQLDLKRFSGSGKPYVKADWFTGVTFVSRERPAGLALSEPYVRYIALVIQRGKVLSRTPLEEQPVWI